MSSQMRDPMQLKVVYLREKCRNLGLSMTGNKADLIARLDEVDPSRDYAKTQPEFVEEQTLETTSTDTELLQREMELITREKAIAEKELENARQQIQQLRTQHAQSGNRVNNAQESTDQRVNLNELKELLNCFDGADGDYDNWEKQIKFVKTTYGLSEGKTKILISTRMKGKALEWFHSKPDHLEISLDELFGKMKAMFDHRPSKLVLRKHFEERMWKYSETFSDYVHEKTILGNRVPIDDGEMVDYVIDGIPDHNLKNQARLHNFAEVENLLKAFEKVSLTSRKVNGQSAGRQEAKFPKSNEREAIDGKSSASSGRGKSSRGVLRCYNCYKEGHLSKNCTKPRKTKNCYACGETGHISRNCPKTTTTKGQVTHVKEEFQEDDGFHQRERVRFSREAREVRGGLRG